MTWTVSTIVSEIFYCIIGLFFISNGVKALKRQTAQKNYYRAVLVYPGHHLHCRSSSSALDTRRLCGPDGSAHRARLVAPSKSDVPQAAETRKAADKTGLRRIHSAAYPGSHRGAGCYLLKGARRQ